MSIEIIKPGLCSSIQDQGRYGYQAWGIGTGGAMDMFAAAAGNFLVGNEAAVPLVEMGYPAATIRFKADSVIAITGADFCPLLDGVPAALWRPLHVKAGMILRFEGRIWGNWCYLAVAGGFDIPAWLYSYSTNIRAGAGGFEGRWLRQGDILPVLTPAEQKENGFNWGLGAGWRNWYTTLLQVLPGTEWAMLSEDARNNFTDNSFGVSPQSDRMGYVFSGPTLLSSSSAEKTSSAVTRGVIQLLPSGQCIVLMADHQTTGGYPHIGTVTQQSLPALAQHSFSLPVKFSLTTLASAEDALFSMHQWLREVKVACLQQYNRL